MAGPSIGLGDWATGWVSELSVMSGVSCNSTVIGA